MRNRIELCFRRERTVKRSLASVATSGSYSVGVAATVHLGAADYTSYAAHQSVTIFAVTATVHRTNGEAR